MSVGRMLQLPPLPDVPEPFRGRSFVAIEAILQLPQPEALEVIAPLRSLAADIDTLARIPAAGLSHIHMDPDHPVPCIGDHTMLAELPDQAIEELVMTAGEYAGSPLLLVDLRQLGGALAHAPATAGALGKLNGAFAMTAIGMAMDEPMGVVVDAHLALLTDALTAWDAGTPVPELRRTSREPGARLRARRVPPAVRDQGPPMTPTTCSEATTRSACRADTGGDAPT